MIPMAASEKMELHYFPSSCGEFFLWEGDGNSQFHAAPAGEELRLEIESKVARSYEWVVHRAGAVARVYEESGVYVQEAEREKLRDGSWWLDERRGDLHIVVRAKAGEDRVVMVGF
jgi:dsDNA-binding SOS-regulon protein